MNPIDDVYSGKDLSSAIEANLFSWIDLFGELWEARDDDPPGVRRSICGIPMSLFNSIMDTRLTPENVDPSIQSIIADAESRKVPVLWWVGPASQPSDLAERLLAHGFLVDEDGAGMAVILSHLNDKLPWPAGLSVTHALDEPAWLNWCRTMAAGFEIPAARLDFVVNSWVELLARADPEKLIAYTAFLEQKPVATSMLLLGGGVAGIYAVTTIPEARRKGIGACVTLQPLLDARSLGYQVGVLEASEMGFNVYRTVGFREYCRVCSYVWRPKPQPNNHE